MGRFGHRPGLALAFALIVCALTLLCSAKPAQASCGDYLAHPHGQLTGKEHDSQAPTAPATPCRGPNCGQAPEKQPLPAPQRVVLMPERDAVCSYPSSGTVAQEVTWVVLSDDPLLASFSGLRLFRPPRSVI